MHALTIPVSVSEPHSIANIRKTHDEILEDVRAIVALRDAQYPAIAVEVGLATAFGCTIQGAVPEDDVIRLAARARSAASTRSIPLTPSASRARRRSAGCSRACAPKSATGAGSVHLHNTRGQGLANVVAALDVGMREFDSSHGGLGGCPYAPGATGNIVTEDLVFLLEAMGLRTGIDLERLIEARSVLAAGLPGEELYGHVADAGLPKGFAPHDAGMSEPQPPLPLAGVRVVEFSHVVMGPACGVVLADLGADVIKVEPPAGDKTRTLGAASAGLFTTYGRNKRSVAVDVRTPDGLAFVKRIVARVGRADRELPARRARRDRPRL